MRVILFSAFPQELREILKRIRIIETRREGLFDVFLADYSSHEVIVVRAGIGIRNAELALDYVFKHHTPDVVISLGFGGALYTGAFIGEVILATRVLLVTDSVTNILDLEHCKEMLSRLSGKVAIREGSVLTLDMWRKKSEVREMVTAEIPFPVCDMETFPLAKRSQDDGVRFFAIRAITDRGHEDIPYELLNVSDESGHYRVSRALTLLLSRPRLIPDSIKLGVRSYIAGKSLWRATSTLMGEL